MANALKRVANYLGLMDDPEFDTPVSSNVPAFQLQAMFVSSRAVHALSLL